jgi:hypothetical protein
MSKALALVILVATSTALAQESDTQVIQFVEGKPGDVGHVRDTFFWHTGSSSVNGTVRLARSASGTYLINILIPRTTSQGERTQLPPIAEFRIWPLASDGSTFAMVSRPNDGSEPPTVSEGGRERAVFGPFEFKGNGQLIAAAFKIAHVCYLMPVWRDGGPQPAQLLIASPIPCSD